LVEFVTISWHGGSLVLKPLSTIPKLLSLQTKPPTAFAKIAFRLPSFFSTGFKGWVLGGGAQAKGGGGG
jgi:hypothetical protein